VFLGPDVQLGQTQCFLRIAGLIPLIVSLVTLEIDCRVGGSLEQRMSND
jgi:hypothetical protein